jgi:hypothetical protein
VNPDEPSGWTWPPPRSVTEAERAVHVAKSEAAYERLERLNERARRALQTIVVRCPARGCLLVPVYRLALPTSGAEYLAVFHAASGGMTARILNGGFTDDWNGPTVWFPVGCRHGHARIERAWLLEVALLVEGAHGPTRTWEEEVRSMPVEIRRGIASRTFNPPARHWRPK